MSANNYNYYYPPPLPPNVNAGYNNQQQPQQQIPPHHHWNWNNQQYLPSYGRPHYHSPPPNHINNHVPPPPPPPPRPPHGYHNGQPGPRHYPPRGSYRFNNNMPYMSQQNWLRNAYKRARFDCGDGLESKSKAVKKKKKPLSQNVPGRKDWSIQDAERAITLEKEYNKRFKNHSLIIKFPDLEINKDIVSKFHESIENVHFQQPSTARFCFVTLQESADADTVISALNKQKFGYGYLTAEYKKDREDDQNIGPEDIDPLTLYVGNLAQEITKEDMVKTFPKCRRIDIGYAKKMKYTRYAFVTFKNVNDSIDAFKQTHNTEMYSKSLIVRFRRLHGTVGMPGESKPQNPPRSRIDDQSSNLDGSVEIDDYVSARDTNLTEISSSMLSLPSTSGPGSYISNDESFSIKEEPTSDEEEEKKPSIDPNYVSPFLPGPIDSSFICHKPKVKREVKAEMRRSNPITIDSQIITIKEEEEETLDHQIKREEIKREPTIEDEFDYQNNYHEYVYTSDDDEDEDDILDRATDFAQLYKDMTNHANILNSLKNTQ